MAKRYGIYIYVLILAMAFSTGCDVVTDPAPGTRQTILEVTDVQLLLAEKNPQQLIVKAKGRADTLDWMEPQLIPFEYLVPPEDGIYDFTFTAVSPENPAVNVNGTLSAEYVYDIVPENLKGVRVHAEINDITVLLTVDHTQNMVTTVTRVALHIIDGKTRQLNIVAEGEVPTAGWTNPRLEPVNYIQPPQDGIYDYTFTADLPTDVVAQVVTPIKGELTLDVIPADLKGVRIHAQTNAMEALLVRGDGELTEIYEVTSVELVAVKADAAYEIVARGVVPSGGWTDAQLIPYLYIMAPQDGIYDYTFVARPPKEMAIQVLQPIVARYPLSGIPTDLRGVRIHAQQNSVEQIFDPLK